MSRDADAGDDGAHYNEHDPGNEERDTVNDRPADGALGAPLAEAKRSREADRYGPQREN